MKERKEKERRLFCPYCNKEIMASDFPYCQVCKVAIFYCPKCRKTLPRNNKVCPHCGAEIRGEVT